MNALALAIEGVAQVAKIDRSKPILRSTTVCSHPTHGRPAILKLESTAYEAYLKNEKKAFEKLIINWLNVHAKVGAGWLIEPNARPGQVQLYYGFEAAGPKALARRGLSPEEIKRFDAYTLGFVTEQRERERTEIGSRTGSTRSSQGLRRLFRRRRF